MVMPTSPRTEPVTTTHTVSPSHVDLRSISGALEDPVSAARAFLKNPEEIFEAWIACIRQNPKEIMALVRYFVQQGEDSAAMKLQSLISKLITELTAEEKQEFQQLVIEFQGTIAPNDFTNPLSLLLHQPMTTPPIRDHLQRRIAEVSKGIIGKLDSLKLYCPQSVETRDRLVKHFSQLYSFSVEASEAFPYASPFQALEYLEKHYKLMGKSPQVFANQFINDFQYLTLNQVKALADRFVEVCGGEKPLDALLNERILEIFQAAARGMSDPIGRILIEGFVDFHSDDQLWPLIPSMKRFQHIQEQSKAFWADRPRVTAYAQALLEDPELLPLIEQVCVPINAYITSMLTPPVPIPPPAPIGFYAASPEAVPSDPSLSLYETNTSTTSIPTSSMFIPPPAPIVFDISSSEVVDSPKSSFEQVEDPDTL